MQDHYDLIDKSLPDTAFFHLDEQLEKATGFSRGFWKKQIVAGHIKVVQHNAKRPGSRQLIPRREVVRRMAEMVR